MQCFVLLRAVNVAGRALTMETFRRSLTDLGYGDVRTLGASGNAVVAPRGQQKAADVEREVEAALRSGPGLSTTAFVREGPDWDKVVNANPFPKEAERDPAHLVVTVLKSDPAEASWSRLPAAIVGRERAARGVRCAYLVYPDGIGRSKLTLPVIERALGVPGTSRNWNTVLALQRALAQDR